MVVYSMINADPALPLRSGPVCPAGCGKIVQAIDLGPASVIFSPGPCKVGLILVGTQLGIQICGACLNLIMSS